MKIYTKNDNEIVAINNEPEVIVLLLKTKQSQIEMFGNLCDACIQGYKYESQYELLFLMRKEATQGMRNHESCCII